MTETQWSLAREDTGKLWKCRMLESNKVFKL